MGEGVVLGCELEALMYSSPRQALEEQVVILAINVILCH